MDPTITLTEKKVPLKGSQKLKPPKPYVGSVLRYAGGKSRAVKILQTFLPPNIKEICSPFCGGLSFELYCASQGIQVYANDLFEPLMVFWTCLKENPEKVIHEIEALIPISKERFLDLRHNYILNDKIDRFQRAAIFFVLNRCSFSGTTLSGGFSQESSEKRLTRSSINKLRKINLSNITFFNEDATNFMSRFSSDVWVFADPPYKLENSNLYGLEGKLHKHFLHDQFAKAIKQRNNFILCYNNNPYIKELYKDLRIETVNWAYGMSEDKKSKEIVILK